MINFAWIFLIVGIATDFCANYLGWSFMDKDMAGTSTVTLVLLFIIMLSFGLTEQPRENK